MTRFSSWQLICVLVLVYLTHQGFKAIKYNGLRRKWYTKPCRKSGQSSLQRTRAMKEASKKGRLFEYHEQQFIRENAHTLEMRVFTQTIFMTKSAENVKCMLSQNFQDWSLGPRSRAFRPLLGHGIFVSDGARWESSRKLLKPQFSREQISHVRMLEPHVQNLFKRIKAHNGARFDIQPLFHSLTLDAATEFLFGESVGTLNFDKNGSVDEIERKKKFSHAIGFIQEYLIKRANLLNYCWLLNSAEFRRNVKFVHDFTTDFIKKAQIASGTSDASSNYVFLRELLKQTSDPTILRDETLNIMLAGRSTTASLLSSLIYELARNPSVWLKLREVVSINFGKGEGGAELDSITFETLAKCSYLRYVMNETLRLHPPVSQNARQATKFTTLPVGGGPDGQSPVFIKKGDIVVFQIHSMHRQRDLFGDDADCFRPERWAALNHIGSAFLPFGTGSRVCLGQKYALTEASYILVRLAQTFPTLEHDNSAYPPRKRSTATTVYMDGVNVHMS